MDPNPFAFRAILQPVNSNVIYFDSLPGTEQLCYPSTFDLSVSSSLIAKWVPLKTKVWLVRGSRQSKNHRRFSLSRDVFLTKQFSCGRMEKEKNEFCTWLSHLPKKEYAGVEICFVSSFISARKNTQHLHANWFADGNFSLFITFW